MDKQKQIEEIYRIIDNNCALVNNCIECQFGKQDKFDCDKLCVANAIYNAGYRKIPENAVVLTREEYEELQIGKDFNYGYHNGESNMTSYYENIRLPEARKETAEKFAERLKEVLGSRFNYIDSLIKSKIDEIYKEITEG